MKNTTLLYIAFLFLAFAGCKKEETLKINITDSTASPFYLSLKADGDLIEKNLSWYGGFSIFRERYSSFEESLRIRYTWSSTPSTFLSSHYDPTYYDDMSEGFVMLEIYDSTLLDKLVGTTVSSDQYGGDLNIRMAFTNQEKGWESVGSVFDFRINSIKDTTMVDFPFRRESNYKIISLDIPNIQMRQIEDTTQSIAVEDIKMRFLVIYTP